MTQVLFCFEGAVERRSERLAVVVQTVQTKA